MPTFCSDDCLKSTFPDVDVEELKAEAGEEECWAYWTEWME